MSTSTSATLEKLKGLLSPDQISTDAETLQTYGKDWTKFFEVRAQAVVFPQSATEVVALVTWARQTKTALVPSGGRTGLSGGAVASQNEVVVSLDRMNKILEFNEIDRTVTVQAGVVTEALQEFAISRGYFYPVDFAAVGSSQIGGNIATNAGGVKVVRYGCTREWVKGLKVVTGSGELLDLNRSLVKNATGYDLRHLFIGSEGTLGFIVEATMGLTHQPGELSVILLALPNLEAMMQVFAKFRTLPLTAFEMFSAQALKKVRESTGLPAPLPGESPFYALAEVEILGTDTQEQVLETFTLCMEEGLVTDGNIAQNSQQAKELWRYREDISESLSPHTPYKNDISVCISKAPQFLVQADAVLKKEYPNFEVIWFGHIGDGNLHINILKPDSMAKDEFVKNCQRVDEILFAQIETMGGSISAEHGVGLVKKPFLKFSRSSAEVEYCRHIKRVFDPDNILNPGKIF